jgi:hypothetical protein
MLTLDDSPPAHTFVSTPLPFSQRTDVAWLERQANHLAHALELPARPRIVYGDAESGLESERRFRLAWWTHGVEPLRAALQRAKMQAYRAAHDEGRESQFTDEWKRAEKIVNDACWRKHLRRMIDGRREVETAYLQAAFRFAQQVWSRSARWGAALGARGVDPFAPLLKLLSAGAWPLGCSDGTLWVFVWDDARGRASEFGLPASVQPEISACGGHIFLSALFRDTALTEGWRARMHANGWRTLYGPVSEAGELSPEVQLGVQIRSARAVVGIVREVDADFGLPWWIFQELDYARACRRPVYLITEQKEDDAVVRRHVRPFLLPPNERTACPDERDVWSWLEINAPHNGGRDV